jgi:cysteine desulfurase family protein (TIGR01976 family)
MTFDVARVRDEFPSLAVKDAGRRRVYFDNPGGTQVPRKVIDRITDCLIRANANLGGSFASSVAAGEIVEEAHRAMADFLGAASAEEIVFGQNMTTLTFHLSRSLALTVQPGDEIVVSRMDHDANISPWLLLARDRDAVVRWVDFDTQRYEFDLAKLRGVLGPRTRIVAFNYASNATGTINDIPGVVAAARELAPQAIVYVDAVQFAPHGLIDVQKLGCDFLVCSPYKFFGPHQGVLWGQADRLKALEPYKVRPGDDRLPYRFETGTLSHESMAGTLGAIEHFVWLGETFGPKLPVLPGESSRRRTIRAAWKAMESFEASLTLRLIAGLQRLPGIVILGITDPDAVSRRVPTVSFTHERLTPRELEKIFAKEGIFVWEGHNYAIEVMRSLKLLDTGSALRVGLAHYNTEEEVDFFLETLKTALLANSSPAERPR